MHQRKRDLWKMGIVLADILLVLLWWTPVLAANTYQGTLALATKASVTVQATPTEDATVTTLNKEKLAQEVQQLREQNDRSAAAWLWNSGGLFGSMVAALLAVAGVLWTAKVAQNKNLADREAEREKQAEERFQSAVTGLADERPGAKIGAAILLRTFLHKDYEPFYTQIFDLVVAHLQLRKVDSNDPNVPLPLDALSQALILVFKEVFPRVRNQQMTQSTSYNPKTFDATAIQLDRAFLAEADLQDAWLPKAFLRRAHLAGAHLEGIRLKEANMEEVDLRRAFLKKANLEGAHLENANLDYVHLEGGRLRGAFLKNAHFKNAHMDDIDLEEAHLEGAHLISAWLNNACLFRANMEGSDLKYAHLDGARLQGACLQRAELQRAYLKKAHLAGAHLEGAHLEGAHLNEADLTRAHLDGAHLDGAHLEGIDFEKVTSLRDAKMKGVSLIQKQRKICQEKGATVDEGFASNASQPTVELLPAESGNNAQAPLVPPTQSSPLLSDTDSSSAFSSKCASEKSDSEA